MQYERIFCFGDSITLGANDSHGLGWPGRLGRGLSNGERSVAIYNLGINGDTSAHIAARWRAEALARSRNAAALMLFAFGFNDASAADGGDLQVALADSLNNARAIISAAKSTNELLWIGPTPLDESVNPLQTPYASWITRNADIEHYDAAYAELARSLDVDYLGLYPEFASSPRYAAALVAGDRVHPGDDGYALIAERIAAWDKWQQYL
jgi:lysophospholipase L1-like esterase